MHMENRSPQRGYESIIICSDTVDTRGYVYSKKINGAITSTLHAIIAFLLKKRVDRISNPFRQTQKRPP